MSAGASPAGVEPGNEAEAARTIREMFGRVAPRYDLLNRLLSMSIDQHWRRYLVRQVRHYLANPQARVLDLCCGTGDLLLALAAARRRLCGPDTQPVVGSDFCRPMLMTAAQKAQRSRLATPLVEADALQFPLPGGSLDLITIAWGFRNFANYRRGLEEMYRLLRPNGCLAILEFSQPTNRVWGPLFNLYFRQVLPRVGNAISGAGAAYSYLQRSVERFPTPPELAAVIQSCGFRKVQFHPLTGGITVLHLAYK